MAGTQTHGYDAVLEFSPAVLQNIVSAFFDTDQHFKNDVFTPVFNTFLAPLSTLKLTDNFQAAVAELGIVPAPVGVDTQDDNNFVKIDMVMNDPSGTLGNTLSTMTMVVGITFDTSNTEFSSKFITLDFKEKLYSFVLTLPAAVSALLPGLQDKLADKLREASIGLIPLKVYSGTENPERIAQAELKIINGESIQKDALAAMLTFGGGTSPGDLEIFEEAFDRQGAGSAITLGLNWVARLISPAIENSFGLEPGSFRDLLYTGSKPLSDGANLVFLSLEIQEDKILFTARITKSGTCYDADATLKAGITIGVTNGTLTVGYEVEDLDSNTDISFWCWIGLGILVGALIGTGIGIGIGAVVGGIGLGAAVGAIAGGGLGAVIGFALYSILEYLLGPVGAILQTISDQLGNGIDFALEIVPVDLDVDLQNAFIDDIAIGYAVYPAEYAQIKSEGTLTVRNGQYIDLDNGIVSNESFGGADLRLAGVGDSRNLKLQCGVSLCHLPGVVLKRIRRYDFYFAFTGNLQTIGFTDLCVHFPFNLPGVPEYMPTRKIFGLRTSDGRFSAIQVSSATDGGMVIKYRTYAANELSVTIRGGFSCIPRPFVDLEEFVFEGYESVAAAIKQEDNDDTTETTPQPDTIVTMLTTKKEGPVFISDLISHLKATDEKKRHSSQRAVGQWTKTIKGIRKKSYGNFKASVNSTSPIISYIWSVEGVALSQNSRGTVPIKGISFEYIVQGKFLRLSSAHADSFDFLINLTVVTEQGITQKAYRCVTYKNSCLYTVVVPPSINEFLEKFNEEYGRPAIPVWVGLVKE